jgi:hypothetical protein
MTRSSVHSVVWHGEKKGRGPFGHPEKKFIYKQKKKKNLAKLDDGLDESPTVMVGEDNKQKTIFGKNRGILKHSWAFVKTKNKTIIVQPQPNSTSTQVWSDKVINWTYKALPDNIGS